MDRKGRRRAKQRRRLGFLRGAALVLAVLGGVLVAAGWVSDGTAAVGTSPRTGMELATPMLSARRVPDLVLRPTADLKMAKALAPLAQQSPPDSCISVGQAGGPVFELRPDTPLLPASNLKILVGAVALEVLGPETTLTTRVVADADPVGGTVQGDLYFVGGGDPIIETGNYDASLMFAPQPHTALEGLADAVRAAGVTKVTGNVVGDDGRYDDLRTVESWDPDDLSNGEVGPLSALSVNDARDRTNGGDLDDIVSGAISDPAADPPAHAAEVLRELLIARGVVVEGAFASGEAPDQARQIAAVDSLPVEGLVAQMLQFSDNNTAELLLKEVGRERSGVGSTAAGIKVELELLKEWGISTEGVVIVDASGLSGADRVTCTLLRRVLDHGEADGLLAKALAVPGENGTLLKRWVDSPAREAVRAKSGTLSIVTGLSGWVRTPAEFDLSFSYLINRPGANIVQDDLTRQEQLTETLLSYPQLPDPKVLAPSEPRPVGSGS